MNSHATGQDRQVFRLIYRSRDRIEGATRTQELGKLFTVARSSNKERDITGALLMSDGAFVQVLEGEEQAVRTLFERIAQDPRHDSVEVLDQQTVADRVFSRWAMARVAAVGDTDIPLIAHGSGISPAAPRPRTPEQTMLLDDMRSAARDAARTG